MVRVGGDYLWEQRYLESGKQPIPLADFYESGAYKNAEYAVYYRLIRRVLTKAVRVIFNSDTQRGLYERFYGLSTERTTVIQNPVPRVETADIVRGTPTKEFVYWGRFIVMKNLDTLIRAFAQARIPEGFTLTLVGEGPRKADIAALVRELGMSSRVSIVPGMKFRDVLERVKNCRAFILPSWTDISPNQVCEALAIGLPALVTKENYLSIRDQLPDMLDPRSSADIAAKIEMLADDTRYGEFSRACEAIRFDNDWNAVTKEHLKVFRSVLGNQPAAFRVLQIGADRSKRGILYRGSPAAERQRAYAQRFGQLDIIGFSRRSDRAHGYSEPHLDVYPTDSISQLWYGTDAVGIARRSPQPDVVSAQDPFETGLVALFIARRSGVPLHVQVHTDLLSPEYAAHSFKNRVRVLVAGFVLRRASRIRVVSQRIKDGIEKRYKVRATVSVLPIFADVAAAGAKADGARFARFSTKLLLVSRLEPEKNIALAIRSFAQAAPKDACLIVVGEGSERKDLERLAKDLDVSDRVFFEGERPGASYYSVADLVLVTSRYEGYGLVIIEALARGVPVLSTDVGVAREAGAVVATPEKFADALAGWFKNGPREGHLTGYPYKNFDEYVKAYCDDIISCTKQK